MTKPSRFVRPENPGSLILQPRDRQVLHAVYTHRYLTSVHLHQLAFAGSGKRVAQARLRRLWAHQLLDRTFIPFVLTGQRQRQNNRPVYSLTALGADLIADELGLNVDDIPHTPTQNARGNTNLKHNLIATDLLVGVEAGLRQLPNINFVSVERDPLFLHKVQVWRNSGGGHDEAVVSDGAFTLKYPDHAEPLTFHIEIVRAGVKGGNRNLLAKLNKYVRLHRDGFFARVYGHQRVRTVLIATTNQERAERFQKLAATLPYGRRLFWFASYDNVECTGVPITSLSPDTILDRRWIDGEGDEYTLASPVSPSSSLTNPGESVSTIDSRSAA